MFKRSGLLTSIGIIISVVALPLMLLIIRKKLELVIGCVLFVEENQTNAFLLLKLVVAMLCCSCYFSDNSPPLMLEPKVVLVLEERRMT